MEERFSRVSMEKLQRLSAAPFPDIDGGWPRRFFSLLRPRPSTGLHRAPFKLFVDFKEMFQFTPDVRLNHARGLLQPRIEDHGPEQR